MQSSLLSTGLQHPGEVLLGIWWSTADFGRRLGRRRSTNIQSEQIKRCALSMLDPFLSLNKLQVEKRPACNCRIEGQGLSQRLELLERGWVGFYISSRCVAIWPMKMLWQPTPLCNMASSKLSQAQPLQRELGTEAADVHAIALRKLQRPLSRHGRTQLAPTMLLRGRRHWKQAMRALGDCC